MKISAAAAAVMLDAFTALLDSGGTIKIYTGSAPSNVETSATGTLLATCALSSDSFPAATANSGTSATASANAITEDSSADASGTAGYFRACKSDGTAIDQGPIGTSGTDMIVPSTTVTEGVPFQISSWTLTMPC